MKMIVNSGKFKLLDQLLPDVKKQVGVVCIAMYFTDTLVISYSNQKGCKAVIFSQWTMIIDILEEYLRQRNFKFLRLDGSTPVGTR